MNTLISRFQTVFLAVVVCITSSAAVAQPTFKGTILEALLQTDGAQALVAAVQAGDEAGCLQGIAQTLDDPKAGLVVFAPGNGAFETLLRLNGGELDGQTIDQIKNNLEALLNSLELTQDDLCAVLLKHVAVDQRKKDSSAAELLERGEITMADGSEFPISVGQGGVAINYESQITQRDVFTQNGVIHYVENVIVDAPPPAPDAVTVFVTSEKFTGDLGGLAGADALCAQAASRAGLAGNTWTAWLSDGTGNAYDRIPDGEYRTLDGTLVGIGRDDLIQGVPLKNALTMNEFGDFSPPYYAWTGTGADGTNNDNNCSDWKVGVAPTDGESCSEGDPNCATYGSTLETEYGWTDTSLFGNDTSLPPDACSVSHSLYCFGDPQ